MTSELGNAVDWNRDITCTITALSSVTGLRPMDLAERLSAAAQRRGASIPATPQKGYDMNDWISVMQSLGYSLAKLDMSNPDFAERMSIDQFMRGGFSEPGPVLVYCDDNAEIGHVFAADAGEVVDTYTHGLRTTFREVPPDYRQFRVKYSFLISDGSAG